MAGRARTEVLRTVAGPDGAAVDVEVRRSARRRRTVSAYRQSDRVVVLVPDRLTAAEEQRWIETMVSRVVGRGPRRGASSDAELAARAARLSERYLGGRADPASVRWVGNQGSRWGSCTVEEGTIRISDRLRGLPAWVVDYVLLHELAHLVEPDHGPRFWSLLAAYPRLERARGYLEGLTAADELGRPASASGGSASGG